MNEFPVIAILDDEADMRKALSRLLRGYGFEVSLFENGESLLASDRGFDCILLDIYMPGMSGFAVLEAMGTDTAVPPVIVITGHDESDLRERAIALGAHAYLTKPIDEKPLMEAIWASAGVHACPLNEGSIDPGIPAK